MNTTHNSNNLSFPYFFHQLLNLAANPVPEGTTTYQATPAYTLATTDTHHVIALDVPGVEKKDVTIELENGALNIEARRHIKLGAKEQHVLYRRTFEVSEAVKDSDIQASLENGVLTVQVQKPEKSVKKAITVA